MSPAAGGAAAAAIVASHERVEPIVYSATMIGNTYWPSTVVAIATARVTASTANGQRRRTSSGSVAASPKPASTRSCSIPLARVVPTTGTPTAKVIATSTTRGDGSPSHARRAEDT